MDPVRAFQQEFYDLLEQRQIGVPVYLGDTKPTEDCAVNGRREFTFKFSRWPHNGASPVAALLRRTRILHSPVSSGYIQQEAHASSLFWLANQSQFFLIDALGQTFFPALPIRRPVASVFLWPPDDPSADRVLCIAHDGFVTRVRLAGGAPSVIGVDAIGCCITCALWPPDAPLTVGCGDGRIRRLRYDGELWLDGGECGGAIASPVARLVATGPYLYALQALGGDDSNPTAVSAYAKRGGAWALLDWTIVRNVLDIVAPPRVRPGLGLPEDAFCGQGSVVALRHQDVPRRQEIALISLIDRERIARAEARHTDLILGGNRK
jgi:hypothetical protein